MHRLGVVAEGLLGESLRVAALERSLGPSVAVGVQRYPFDSQALAALLEFRGPVAGANCCSHGVGQSQSKKSTG